MWQDSLSRVYASGVSVEIDSVLHFVSTQVITKERDVIVKVKPKWSIGVHAGYGAFANNGQIATSPYIGVGVSYNLFSW
jgi:outer membrane protein W